MRIKDMKGKKCGKLLPIELVGRDNGGQAMWRCECDCGNITVVRGQALRSGSTYTCGECEQNHGITIHGMTNTRIYRTWINMKDRCGNPKYIGYHNYGGRGIKVCEEWGGKRGFVRFYDWAIKNGYTDTLTIDRIDFNKGYCPENCKWSTTAEQSIHKRTSRMLELNGCVKTITEWSREYGILTSTVDKRIQRGWSVVDALETPPLPAGVSLC